MKARPLLFALCCLLAFADRLTAAAATAGSGQDRLRALIRTPMVNLSFGFNIDDAHGFGGKDVERARTQVEAVQQALKKDPKNAQLHVQLGQGLTDTGDTNRAAQEFKQAVELMRPTAQANPDDGRVQAAFADALLEVAQYEEAERRMRAPVERLPRDWHCWKMLGTVLQNQAARAWRRRYKRLRWRVPGSRIHGAFRSC